MPAEHMSRLVQKSLGHINFSNTTVDKSSSTTTLRDSLSSGSGIKIEVLDANRFNCTFQENRLHTLLRNELKLYVNRVRRQNDAALHIAANRDTPNAWLIVTSYYSAFYASQMICKLLGKYQLYFDLEDVSRVNSHSASYKPLKQSGYYSSDGFIVHSEESQIVLGFAHKSTRGHVLNWQNFDNSFEPKRIEQVANANRRNRLQLFRNIISTNASQQSHKWPSPNTLRNKWNYAKATAYEPSGDATCPELKKYVRDQQGNLLMNWARKSRLPASEKNLVLSMAFVNYCLIKAIEDLNSRLLISH